MRKYSRKKAQKRNRRIDKRRDRNGFEFCSILESWNKCKLELANILHLIELPLTHRMGEIVEMVNWSEEEGWKVEKIGELGLEIIASRSNTC